VSDLYAELGLERTADADTIRQAYRLKAQKHHPDKGGDRAAFQRIQKAYDTLSDTDRRQHYDTTGETQDAHVDEEANLMSALTSLLLQIMDRDDVDHTNILATARDNVRNAIAQLASNRTQITSKMGKRERALKRLKRRGEGKELLLLMLGAEIEKMRQALAALDLEVKRQERLVKLIDGYEYAVDPMPQPTWPEYGQVDWQTLYQGQGRR
jgi:curved DNA-binding protein CbpA